MREAHLRDAVAVCSFLKWIEDQVGWGCGMGVWVDGLGWGGYALDHRAARHGKHLRLG